jgi:hypothetical protein
MKQIVDIQEAIHNLNEEIDKAYRSFDEWMMTADDYSNPSWLIEENIDGSR